MGLIINTPNPAITDTTDTTNEDVVVKLNNNADIKSEDNTPSVINTDSTPTDNTSPPPSTVNPSETIVEIEGESFILDTNGNAIKEGKIIYTKDQLEDESDSMIDAIQENTGLVLTNDEGEPISFSDDVEGLIAREKAVISSVKRQTEKQVLEDFYKTNPEIEGLLNYKKLHGSIKDYNFKTNYSTVKFIENDIENHKQLVSEELREKGLTEDDIEVTINALVTTNKLKSRAKNSETYLNGIAEQDRLETETELKRRQAIKQEEIEREYGVTIHANKEVIPLNISGSIYDLIVAKGKVGEYVIPETGITFTQNGVQKTLTRLDIFNYIALAKENGLSQAQIDDMQYTTNIENRLMRYLSNILRSNSTTPNKIIKKVKTVSSSNYTKTTGGVKKLKLNYNIN